MATDATGSPTPLGIPKYNTSADAPSGLGFNAAMDAIDALLSARVSKPSGISAGEVPVWNGSSFVRSSVTNVGPASLGSGTPSSLNFLRGDGVWATAAGYTVLRKTSVTDVVNTTTATDLLAGVGVLPVLTTTGIVAVTIIGDYLNNSGAGVSAALEVKLGATTIWKDTIVAAGNSFASANRRAFRLQLEIINQSATNSQQAGGYWWLGAEDLPTTGTGGSAGGSAVVGGMAGIAHHEAASPFGGSAAEDTSVSKTLTVNVTHGTAAATISWRALGAIIEVK